MNLRDELLSALRVQSFPEWLQNREVAPAGWRFDWPHLTALCGALERVTTGETNRLMVFMPPRHCKSETTARYLAYRLEQDPTLTGIVSSYAQSLANRLSRKVRRVVEARKVPFTADAYSVEDWELLAGGGVRAAGVGGGVTGMGARLILIDDPVKGREEADSEVMRERAWDWYLDDIHSRLEPGGAIVVVMTRWHEDDLAGRLLAAQDEGGEQWDVLSLPALAEDDDPLGRAPGEALCPDRYDAVWMEAKKSTSGPRSFAALYQQRPVPLEGLLLRTDRVEHSEADPASLRIYQAWDLAISQKATADYTACATVGVDGAQNAHLLHLWRGRVSFDQTVQKMAEMAEAWKPQQVGIETVGYQSAAFQEASRRHMLPFREVKADRDKVTRAQLLAARIDAGKFFANRKAAWWPGFEEEAIGFPAGKHDDMVDAVVHALALAQMPAFFMPFFHANVREVPTRGSSWGGGQGWR
jgi:predicted phage terminase large subunit-like protein